MFAGFNRVYTALLESSVPMRDSCDEKAYGQQGDGDRCHARHDKPASAQTPAGCLGLRAGVIRHTNAPKLKPAERAAIVVYHAIVRQTLREALRAAMYSEI